MTDVTGTPPPIPPSASKASGRTTESRHSTFTKLEGAQLRTTSPRLEGIVRQQILVADGRVTARDPQTGHTTVRTQHGDMTLVVPDDVAIDDVLQIRIQRQADFKAAEAQRAAVEVALRTLKASDAADEAARQNARAQVVADITNHVQAHRDAHTLAREAVQPTRTQAFTLQTVVRETQNLASLTSYLSGMLHEAGVYRAPPQGQTVRSILPPAWQRAAEALITAQTIVTFQNEAKQIGQVAHAPTAASRLAQKFPLLAQINPNAVQNVLPSSIASLTPSGLLSQSASLLSTLPVSQQSQFSVQSVASGLSPTIRASGWVTAKAQGSAVTSLLGAVSAPQIAAAQIWSPQIRIADIWSPQMMAKMADAPKINMEGSGSLSKWPAQYAAPFQAFTTRGAKAQTLIPMLVLPDIASGAKATTPSSTATVLGAGQRGQIAAMPTVLSTGGASAVSLGSVLQPGSIVWLSPLTLPALSSSGTWSWPPLTPPMAMGSSHALISQSAAGSAAPTGATMALPSVAQSPQLWPAWQNILGTLSGHTLLDQTYPDMDAMFQPMLGAGAAGASATAATPSVLSPTTQSPQQFATLALLFFASFVSGDVRGVLGTRAHQNLSESADGIKLLSRLNTDLASMRQSMSVYTQASSTGADPLWQRSGLPMMNESGTWVMPVFSRQGDDESAAQSDETGIRPMAKPTRFLINIAASKWGELQLDGYLRKASGTDQQGLTAQGQQLDMVLRLRQEIDRTQLEGLRQHYRRALHGLGMTGDISFQTKPEDWVRV